MEAKVEKTEEEWREELTPEEYEVLRRHGTEPPFTGKYVHSKEDGIYRCAACGNELFSSDAKFESGTGWPSFTEPAIAEAIETRDDRSYGMVRTEVLCRRCGGRLRPRFVWGAGAAGRTSAMCSMTGRARRASAGASTRSR